MNKRLPKLIAVLLVSVIASASVPALAAGAWAQHHPRRVQVNRRLARQNGRIRQEAREGDLTRAKARRLHRADHRIRMEERHFSARHHGAITPAEQARLNRQENRVSRRIGQ
ncbi:MAG: hypothetical protein M0037_14420 [Betaproteobacteria bacterium]|nr:hypothetical protein [Betaproteobacteria bacterium]